MNLNELPGAEFVLPGLEALHRGETTIESLLIAIAATRLTQAGITIPIEHLTPDPELTLYAHLEAERDDAYLYYNALLDRLDSFCNALELSHEFKETSAIAYNTTIL